MRRQIRLLFGISVFWLALSLLFDGINTLVLPLRLSGIVEEGNQASALGLLTFAGLLAGAVIQPVAGAFSDRLRHRLGRNRFIGAGLLLSLAGLWLFAGNHSLLGMIAGYLAIQVAASIAQAGQQGLIPDLVNGSRRGLASGMKGFMDLTGAMLGFVLLGQLLGTGQLPLAVLVIAGVLVAAYLLALFLTPEDRAGGSTAAPQKRPTLRQIFRFDLSQHSAFGRLIIARFLFLLGIYGTGRFLLFFVADRLGLSREQAAEQAGNLLAGLALVTVLASPVAGWLADRIGRVPLMIAGAMLSAVSAFLLLWGQSLAQLLLFGALMSLGSAAFSGGSWAWMADLVPKQEAARFFGLANFSIAGAAAAAGLYGPIIDWADRISPGTGYSILFILASLTFLASAFSLKNASSRKDGKTHENKAEVRSNAPGLAVVSVPADPAIFEEDDQDPPGRTARL